MPDAVHRAVGTVALVVLAPLLLVLAALIRLDSRGPVLHEADRVGMGGRRFRCLKFRTMIVAADGRGSAITLRNDSRITRIGRFLRRTRLDELPQLINVVRGEMNLVGPRPEDPRFVDFEIPLHRIVFTSKPGITGLAQLAFAHEARMLGTDTLEADRIYREVVLPQKVVLDADYLERRSWRLDIWILGRTLQAVLGRGGAETTTWNNPGG
jgi:lipopolysaccharide/colanic/teichoic acid biosynthesis glycosyltransferase